MYSGSHGDGLYIILFIPWGWESYEGMVGHRHVQLFIMLHMFSKIIPSRDLHQMSI